MDIFNEKIVKKRYDMQDLLIVVGLIVAAFFLIFLKVFLNLGMLTPLLVIGIGYGLFYLISARHVEYEYSVTNGDLDVDKIIARKRIRLLSIEGKDLEILAKLKERKVHG